MKKTIVFLIVYVALIFSTLKAQNVFSDSNFLKATNNLFSASISLDAILLSENKLSERNKSIASIKENLKVSRMFYTFLKGKYPKDVQVEKLKQWNDVLQRIMDALSSEEWESDGIWQLAHVLIKMDLQELVSQKLK